MTLRKSTPKPSFRKRRDRRRRAASTPDEEDYDSVVQSDESANPSGSDQPENEDASYADYSEASWKDPDQYVHVAQFPTFLGGGDECPVAHLSRFAKVCRANNASTAEAMARIFPVTLEAEAALWYDLNVEPYEGSLMWEEIKLSFSDAFGSTESFDPAAISQDDGESVRSYFLRLQSAMRKLGPGDGLSDGVVRDVFVRGLRREVREAVVAEKPGSLSEALRAALRSRGTDVVAGKRCGFCGGVHGAREVNSGCGGESWTEVRRSVSMAEGSEKKGGRQCQCWKHQCWKRNGLERSRSNLTASFKGL